MTTLDVPPSLDPLARPPRWRDPATLQTLTYLLLAGSAAWFLLNQLVAVMRPLMVAAFLTYVLMPYHSRLQKRVGAMVSIGLLAGITATVLVGLTMSVYASVEGLNEELPELRQRTITLAHRVDDFVSAKAPWLYEGSLEGSRAEERFATITNRIARPILNATADVLLEACLVGLYLLFLLLEASRLPNRVRKAYTPQRANEILHLAGQVNSAIISYLKAKVKASLILAVPVGLLLWAFGVKFALFWGVLTFLCNFIPYLGSVVAYCMPVGFAALQLEPGWEPVVLALLVLACHIGCASVIEPMLLGKAVGLSPLVILCSLAFWGLVWGVPGMFLAVPLTVVVVIVLNHFSFTRPVVELISGDEQ